MAGKLKDALSDVDWSANVAAFLGDPSLPLTVEDASLRIAVWARQIEKIEKGNAALGFIREMQSANHQVACLIALGLYKPAAALMRTTVESALYYTYFRSHPKELATLACNADFYISKDDIITYHKMHTPGFAVKQEKLGLVGKMKVWYSYMSAIVHGQVPGVWSKFQSIAEIDFNKDLAKLAVERLVEGERIVHDIFLCTLTGELWDYVSTAAKGVLLKGLSGDIKVVFKLDAA